MRAGVIAEFAIVGFAGSQSSELPRSAFAWRLGSLRVRLASSKKAQGPKISS
jgi:hypothetical protein